MPIHNIIKSSLLLLFVFTKTNLFSQNAGIQLLVGPQYSITSFDDGASYSTLSNNDTRIGVVFGDFDKLSCGILFGKNRLQAQTTTENVTSQIELGYISIDVPITYKIGKAINTVAFGPAMLLNTYNSQTTNNLIVRNSRMFKSTVFGFYGEITTKGWTTDNLDLLPYVYWRSTIGGVENSETDEGLNFHQLGLGLKVNILWL